MAVKKKKSIEVKLKAFRNHSLKCITGAEERGCHYQKKSVKNTVKCKNTQASTGEKRRAKDI